MVNIVCVWGGGDIFKCINTDIDINSISYFYPVPKYIFQPRLLQGPSVRLINLYLFSYAFRTDMVIPWYLYQMVTQSITRTHEGKLVFSEKNIRFATAFNLIKCIKKIKQQRLLLTCAHNSELQYNTNLATTGLCTQIYKFISVF